MPQPQTTPQTDAWGQAAAELGQTVPNATQPTQATQPQPQTNDAWGQAQAELSGQTTQEQSPQQTGEIVNDVGNKVIVPKDGEPFADTMRRAVQYHNSLTPEQRQAALDKEVSTIPKKTAQTLGAAATIGAVGPAVMALPGEALEATGAAKNFVLKQLAEQSPQLFGHEAVKETLKRYALKGAKKAMTGAAWAGGAEVLHTIWNDVFGKK
jgi:hypothetical protein